MAKAKTRVTKAGTTTVIMPAASSSPVRRRRSSSPARRSSGRRHHRRRSGGGGILGGGGRSLGSRMVGHGIGGFAVGWIEKSFPQLPTLPFIGRKGAIAVGAYFLAGKHPLIVDVGLAAAAISGYELGTSGKITGDVMGDDTLSSQM